MKLYVIPGSHACRSAMLMLDHKRLWYRTVVLPTGIHPVLLRALGLAGQQAPIREVDGAAPADLALLDRLGTVPALRSGERRIQTNRAVSARAAAPGARLTASRCGQAPPHTPPSPPSPLIRPGRANIGVVTAAELWRRGQAGWPRSFPVVQLPNPPLLLSFAGWGVAAATDDTAHDIGRAVSAIALGAWAWEEASGGVNWLRRLLGAGALMWLVVRLTGEL